MPTDSRSIRVWRKYTRVLASFDCNYYTAQDTGTKPCSQKQPPLGYSNTQLLFLRVIFPSLLQSLSLSTAMRLRWLFFGCFFLNPRLPSAMSSSLVSSKWWPWRLSVSIIAFAFIWQGDGASFSLISVSYNIAADLPFLFRDFLG